MKDVVLVTEDELSEAVGRRLLEDHPARLRVAQCLRKGGSGYLKSRLSNFCQIAAHHPVLLITDLDRNACAPGLIAQWFGKLPRPDQLLFRVAVREVESWLLADHQGLGRMLGISPALLPREPDTLADPKMALLTLARRAPRALREELLAERGAIASQGLGYNLVLTHFVQDCWNPAAASGRSRSLHKARLCLERLAST